MRYLVLDTNILLKDPSILIKWSPNYQIIIPEFILGELDRVSSRMGGVGGQLWPTLEKAQKSKFVEIYKSEVSVSEELITSNSNQKLSYTDLQLVELSKTFLKENKDTVLVTNDRVLRVFAEERNIKTLDLIQFRNYINEFKTVLLNQLKKNETIKKYQFKKFGFGFISGAALALMTNIIIENFQLIYSTVTVWGTLALLIIMGILFFIFRTNFRLMYGLIEFLFGFLIAYRVFIERHYNFQLIGTVELIQVVGAVYVMVRGLTNIDDGIKGTPVEPIWKKLTRWRKIASA